jgi:hypothetical protein
MNKLPRFGLLAVLALLLSGVSTNVFAQKPVPTGRALTFDQELSRMVDEIPGFGGLYYDKQGYPHVYLLDTRRGPGLKRFGPNVRVHQGQYDFRQLHAWKDSMLDVLSLPGVVLLDADEAKNRVRVGIDAGAGGGWESNRDAVLDALVQFGVPEAAVVFQKVPPIHNLATLRDRVRPVPGGVQIAFNNFVCTKGFGANRAGVAGFVTNSHCSGTQGGVQGTVMYQNTNSSANRIGVETADPTYFTGSPCPAGRRCRFSDSAFARYDSTGLREFGRIARTTGVGSLTVSTTAPRFTITATSSGPSSGQTVNKMGRTTGWSRGQVSSTCVNINVSGSNITQLCQSIVNAGVGGGDSGSPVFTASTSSASTNATLVGILWGGDTAGTLFVMSPYNQIVSELGALTVF